MLSVSESWGVFAADALVVAWSCGMLLIDSLQLFGRQNLLKLLVVFFMDVEHLALLCKTLFDACFYFCIRQGWLFTLGTFCTPLGTTFLHRFSIFFATVVHFLQVLLVDVGKFGRGLVVQHQLGRHAIGLSLYSFFFCQSRFFCFGFCLFLARLGRKAAYGA